MPVSGTVPITNPSQDELRALWDSGAPLDDAWLDFTPDNFDGIMLRALRTHPDDDVMFERADDESVRQRYQEIRSWLPKTYETRQIKLRNKIDVQRSYLVDNLYAGELWAIGFRTLETGFDELTRVPRQFFFTDYEQERDVRPNIYWTKGELAAGSDVYFDIRVIRAPGTSDEAFPESDGRVDRPADPKPGRPSERQAILAAISAYAATDPKLKRPRHERYRAYKSYISEQGHDPNRQQGFSDKTIQKYETEFRKNNK